MKQNKFFLSVLLLGVMVSAQDLDVLMKSSAEQVREYDMVPLVPPEKLFARKDTGISTPVVTRSLSAEQVREYDMVPLVPPEKLFARKDTGISTPVVTHSLTLSSISTQIQMIEMEKRLREQEINLTKVSVILENIQKVSEKHSDKFDASMRFFEVIITVIGGIITALIGVYIKGRKK